MSDVIITTSLVWDLEIHVSHVSGATKEQALSDILRHNIAMFYSDGYEPREAAKFRHWAAILRAEANLLEFAANNHPEANSNDA